MFTCPVALNPNFVSRFCSTSNSSALAPTCYPPRGFHCSGLFFDVLRMEFTRRCELPLPVPARLLGKVKIIVSLPTVNTVIPISNNLLGSLTFKTLGLHTLALLGSQEVHQQIAVKVKR